MTDWIAQLCTHVGVHAGYRGFEGQSVEVSRDTQIAVLKAMGLDTSSERQAKARLQHMQSEDTARPLPLEIIVHAGQAQQIPLAHPAAWHIEAETSGAICASGQATQTLSLPALPLGIHRLVLRSGGVDHTTWILTRPVRAVQLENRNWGVLAALYSLTDGGATGIGTYAALGRYAAAMAKHGADFVGINPVHAMGDTRPDAVISPYSPSHRAFLNTWHCAAPAGQTQTGPELIDYPVALEANDRALRDGFAEFQRLASTSPEHQNFDAFTAHAGAPLHDFALFECLAAQNGADWRMWPAPYRDRDAQALAAVEAAQAEAIIRIKWAQWQAEQQLAGAQNVARDAGMRVGLYLDLAVGPRLGGAETWETCTSLVTGATLGAPPDPLGPLGQSWGLAPQSPLKIRTDGYAGFSRLLRAIMRHSGMIRIDHILGLMRSFWIPDGAQEGTYVSYPFDALLAVVAIESARNGTVVVGEDLGLVPAGLREKLAASGIYGLDVMQYMRTKTGGFVDPAQTRKLAVCTFATHDTPTVAGFFAAEDARVRHAFGGIDAQTLEDTRADRNRAKATLNTDAFAQDIHSKLARSNADMIAVQLDDVAGRVSQQNLPGTVDTYPNWRLKAPFTAAEISASAEFAALGDTMRAAGRCNIHATESEDAL